ncbi:MAG: sensor histidine kinase [Polyangiaceae bacterium]
MSKGRLTRQELGWLLTQEASGAAERLRVGVQVLKTNAPPAPLPGAEDPSATGLDATLNVLDDAMKMLSSLHTKPAAIKGRRGRIDLAALIWEVAPDARVSIETGPVERSGTEVFADEGELRRMLHVLIGQGTGAGSAVTIKRDGEDVRVAVVLGPDSSATAETERAWLARMAIRYGGRYELEGGAEVLSFPADGVSERKEREALRKELDEARKQGEAYARELAQAYAHGEEVSTPSTLPPPLHLMPTAERFGALSKFAGGIAAELRTILSAAARQVPSKSGQPPLNALTPSGGTPSLPLQIADGEERWDVVRRALARAQDFVGALASFSEIDAADLSGACRLDEVSGNVNGALQGRADKLGVKLTMTPAPQDLPPAHVAARACTVMLRNLIEQAILASPRGREVRVSFSHEEAGPRVSVEDSGAPLPSGARRAFVALEVEPGTYGRASCVPLNIAAEIAGAVGATVELGDSPLGGLRISVTFGRAPRSASMRETPARE